VLKIYDTTLRDGAQGEGVSFSVEDKLKIAEKLAWLGVSHIEGGWPGANPKDLEFFQAARRLDLGASRLVAFGSTCRVGCAASEDQGLKYLIAAGTPAVDIFGKTWDLHVTRALETSLDENRRLIGESVQFLKEQGREVLYGAEHFFDGYRNNPEYALKTLESAVAGGADWLVLCDTNGGALPGDIEEAVALVVKRFPVPVAIHAHNDGGLAVANSLAAVKAGAQMVQGTFNGLGERCGNADLASIIANLELKLGIKCLPEHNLSRLAVTARFIAETANLPLPGNQPFVGASAFGHKGGVHVSAVLKDPVTYEHIPPEAVGNSRRVLVSEQAGASNLIYQFNLWDLKLSREQASRVVTEVKELENRGYQFEGAEASLRLLAERVVGRHRPAFEVASFRVLLDQEGGGELSSEAVIKIRVGERLIHTAAEGNGPVNAMDNALRKALEEVYPQLKTMHLTDYKVRVLDEQKGTNARVRVLIESQDGGSSWSTVGVSENIIEASLEALVDSMEYFLMLEQN